MLFGAGAAIVVLSLSVCLSLSAVPFLSSSSFSDAPLAKVRRKQGAIAGRGCEGIQVAIGV
jgi:hypothetical protein